MKNNLVKFDTMLDAGKTETAEVAHDAAVELSQRALEEAQSSEGIGDPATAENIHDALSRLGALSRAGKIAKIS